MSAMRCLFLDLGNVILNLDFRPFHLRMQALTGLNERQLRAAIMAGSLMSDYETGRLTDAEFHEEICRRVSVEIPFKSFCEIWSSIFVPATLIPDELLAGLAKSYQLWALSNTNRLHFEFIQGRYSFVRRFRGCVLSHEVGAMKPDERIFMDALRRAGAAASEALFVDDQLPNVEAARRLGIEAFQFLGAGQFAEELRARNIRF
jgi:putative hydrolase of the HAD superfamily